jgi:hypothetical protein
MLPSRHGCTSSCVRSLAQPSTNLDSRSAVATRERTCVGEFGPAIDARTDQIYLAPVIGRFGLALLGSAIIATGAAAMVASYSAAATMSCLSSHRVLVSRVARVPDMPKSLPALATLKLSFALIPPEALDNGAIVFERSPTSAQRVAAAWFEIEKRQIAKTQGVDLSKIKITRRDVFTVSGNTITAWYSQPFKPASRRLVAGCLR